MPAVIAKKPGPPTKGKPMGIPIWGWAIAAALGLIIGYTMLKKGSGSSGTSSPDNAPPDSTSSSPGSESGGGSSGSPGLPSDAILQALGLKPTELMTEGANNPTAANPTGDPAASPATAAASSPGVDPAFTIAGGMDPAIATAYAARNSATGASFIPPKATVQAAPVAKSSHYYTSVL